MDWQHAIDVTLKAMTTLCGMGLAGLAVVRITPRGRWKVIGAEFGPLFDPKHAKTARTVAWVFSVLVMVMMLRSGGRV